MANPPASARRWSLHFLLGPTADRLRRAMICRIVFALKFVVVTSCVALLAGGSTLDQISVTVMKVVAARDALRPMRAAGRRAQCANAYCRRNSRIELIVERYLDRVNLRLSRLAGETRLSFWSGGGYRVSRSIRQASTARKRSSSPAECRVVPRLIALTMVIGIPARWPAIEAC